VCPEISVKLMFPQHHFLVEGELDLIEHHDRRARFVENFLRRQRLGLDSSQYIVRSESW